MERRRRYFQKSPTFNDEITLLKLSVTGKDKYGNQEKEYQESTVLCNELPVQRSEFYLASTSGLDVSYVVSVHAIEYQNEEKAIYKGQELHVIRAFFNGDYVELTLGEKHGG